MYLKRLEIIGFKSFAEKTILEFYPGITIIVGPNGCGKSNLLDALRWGLGEQNSRALRANRMEDIIFNGTDRYPALNFAEVSVVFSNEDRALDYDADEVVITRRLFRSGESQYFINRNQVRLKDITELLMGTGIGAQAYSIVEQGKIDLLLSAKPEERRLVFDEAAGITKYKVKKKETLRKLSETEQNLLRIADIIVEVKRQLNSLERQAKKAKRYQELYSELKEKETILALKKWFALQKEKDEYDNQLQSYKAQIEEKRQKHNQLIKEFEVLRENSFSLEEKINFVQEELSKKLAEFEQSCAKIGMNKDRIVELRRQKELFLEEKQKLLGRIGERQQQLQDLESKIAELEGRLEEVENRIKIKKAELSDFLSSIEALEEQLESNRKALFAKNHNLSSLKNNYRSHEFEVKTELLQVERLESEKEKLIKHIESVEEELDRNRLQLKKLKQEQLHIETQVLPSLERELVEVKRQEQALYEEIEQVKLEIGALEAQKEMLSHLEAKYLALPENRDFDLWVKKANFEIGHIIAKVSGVIEESGDWIHLKCEGKVLPSHFSFLDDRIAELKEVQRQKEILLLDNKNRQNQINEKKQKVEEELVVLKERKSKQQLMIEQQQQIIGDYRKEISFIDEQIKEKRQLILEKQQLLADLQKSMLKLENEIKVHTESLKKLEENLEQKRNRRIVFEQELSKIVGEKNVLEVNLENLVNNLSSLKETVEQDRHIIEERESLQEKIETKILELEEQIELLKKNQKEWDEQIKALRDEKDNLRQRYNELRGNLEARELQRDGLSAEIEQLQKDIYHLELKIQEIEFSLRAVKDHLQELYGVDIEVAIDSTIIPIEVDVDQLEMEIEELKARIKRMGAVSTIAIEEYEELKERFEFLNAQQEDLLKAKETLKQTINKLNRKSEEMFIETFSKIRGEFQRFFRMLFGGGQADIFIIEESDVLESGIEIKAKPPGKQLRNISLLSGGEKSLTAIALIFAVFKVKPSPFCILDEVDAALDESNVDRFTRILRDFSKVSQFLVITHNKKTISSGDVIYGVTMPMTGVSKIISVKLNGESVPRRDIGEFIRR